MNEVDKLKYQGTILSQYKRMAVPLELVELLSHHKLTFVCVFLTTKISGDFSVFIMFSGTTLCEFTSVGT